MPLYEYQCRQCSREFELLVRPGSTQACPFCQSEDLSRLLSSCAVSTTGTRAQSLSAIRRKNAKSTRESVIADHEYDRDHRHEHD